MHALAWQIIMIFLQSMCACVNQHHELILAANRPALKRMKVNAEKSVSQAGGKALENPLSNLVLLHDHQEGCNKIQDNLKSELFVMESKHQDPNVSVIKPPNGKGPMCMVNQLQLFDLQKSQGNHMPSSPASDTKLPTMLMKKPTKDVTPQQNHPYDTRSKTRANSIVLQSSSEDETNEDSTVIKSSSEDERSFGVVGNLFNCLSSKFWW